MTNKKQFKRMLREAVASMPDDKLFFSEAFVNYLHTILEGVVRRYRQNFKILLEKMGKDATAMTDGNHIVINMENSLFADATLRSEKVKRVIGTLLHEAAHILFTDFKVSDKCRESFRDGKFFPEDDSPEFDSWKEWTKENKVTPKMEAYYFNLLNILEDGYIDRRIMKEIPGYAECRQEVLDYRTEEYLEKIAVSKNEVSDKGAKFLNAVLAYAKYGLLPTDCEEEIREAVYKVKYYIDLVYKENRFLNRVRLNNKVYAVTLDLLNQILNNDESESSDKSEESSSLGSDGSKGESSENEEKSDDTKTSEKDSSEEKTESDSSSKETDSESKEESSSSSGESSSEETEESKGSVSDSFEGTSIEGEDNVHLNPVDAAGDDKEIPSSVPYSKKDVDDEFKNLAEKITKDELLGEGIKEDRRIALEANKAEDCHAGVDCRVEYGEPTYEGRQVCETHMSEIENISRRLVRNLLKELKERKEEDVDRGLYNGRISQSSFYRNDKKYFEKRNLPEEVPNMEVILLVDASGSMSCEKRMGMANKAAMLLYRVCEMLEIDISVYAHTTFRTSAMEHVKLIKLADSNALDDGELERICSTEAQANNRDGYALRFCMEKLTKSDAETRIVLVISDGQPYANRYHFDDGEKDIKAAIQKYGKKGILTITAAIGSDADGVKEVYTGDGVNKRYVQFLDIENLEKLPTTFPKILMGMLK